MEGTDAAWSSLRRSRAVTKVLVKFAEDNDKLSGRRLEFSIASCCKSREIKALARLPAVESAAGHAARAAAGPGDAAPATDSRTGARLVDCSTQSERAPKRQNNFSRNKKEDSDGRRNGFS
jgi:hypothetical protein